ncbi:MAG: hypothetical protein ACP5NG_05020 [Conexivisphaera sp.]
MEQSRRPSPSALASSSAGLTTSLRGRSLLSWNLHASLSLATVAPSGTPLASSTNAAASSSEMRALPALSPQAPPSPQHLLNVPAIL